MTKIRVKYFGRICEIIGVKDEEYDANDASLADLLLKYIPERHTDAANEWKKTIFAINAGEATVNGDRDPMLRHNYLILVNGRTCEITYKLRDGDEVAVLPPVGGG
ncbi:MAG: MoaD family protein [Thermoproteota archaeon]